MSVRRRRSAGGNVSPANPRPIGEGIENRVLLKVDAAGRLLIPAEMRASMGLSEGCTVLAWLDRGELRVISADLSAKRVQQRARALFGPNVRLAEELIADRRAEAEREAKNG